jgi:uncharacterized protein GlcG (DUF336 family)
MAGGQAIGAVGISGRRAVSSTRSARAAIAKIRIG